MTWLNGNEAKLAALRGRPVLLHFFDHCEAACLADYAKIEEWRSRYGPHGLTMIGVHRPVLEVSLNPFYASAAVQRLGLKHLLAMDTESQVAAAYGVKATPWLVLVDKDGHIRFEGPGGGNYTETENAIQQVIKEARPQASLPGVTAGTNAAPTVISTMCLGIRCGTLGNKPSAITNGIPRFEMPATREEGRVYVAGLWEPQQGYIRHAADVADDLTDCLSVRYRQGDVFAAMSPEQIYWKRVFVRQNGQWLTREQAGADVQFDEQGRSFVKVDAAGLYRLVFGQAVGTHELQLCTRGKGLSVYSFSFRTPAP